MGLLVGGDFPGYYDWRYPLRYAPYAPDLIYSFGLLITANNPYLGFYIYFIINIFISILAIGILVTEAASLIGQGKGGAQGAVDIAAVLMVYYVSQPLLYLNTFKSILRGLVWIQYTAAYVLLLLALLRLEKGEHRAAVALAALSEILGPLSLPFPNDIRLSALYITTLILYVLLSNGVRKKENIHIKRGILCIFSLVLIFLLAKMPAALAKLQLAKTYAIRHGLTLPRPIEGMNLVDVFIIASMWTRYTKFCPYCSSYMNGPVTILNTILVAVALVLPIFYIKRVGPTSRRVIISMLVLYMLAVFHESRGLIAPSLYRSLYSRLQLGVLFSYAAIMGPVAARHALIVLLAVVAALMKRGQRTLYFALLLLVVVTSLASLQPLLRGEALASFADPHIHGVHIPQDYFKIKRFLVKNHLNTIILPQANMYIQESWGYQGTQKFYHSFFYPAHIIYIGSYAQQANIYRKLTTLVLNSDDASYVVHNPKERYAKNYLIALLPQKVNITIRTFVTMKIVTVSSTCRIARIGLGGDRIAWYLPFRGGLYISGSSSTIYVYIAAVLFNKPWPSSHLSHYIDRIYVVPAGCNATGLDVREVVIGEATTINPIYVEQLHKEGVDAIMLDRGLVRGNETSPYMIEKLFKTLHIEPLLSTYYVKVYSVSSLGSQNSPKRSNPS